MSYELPDNHIEYLRDQVTAVLSTVSPEGAPHSATVFYWINDIVAEHGDFNVYFVTRRHTRKFKNLMNDARVAMVVGTTFEPFTVQLEGEAELVETQDSFEGMEELAQRLHAHPTIGMIYSGAFYPRNPFKQMEGEDFALFRIRPSWVRVMRYDEKEQRLVFEQIRP